MLGGANTIRFNPQLKIHIRGGDGDDTLGAGLVLAGGGATIQGLSISHFDDAQIDIRSSNNIIAGNLVALSPQLEHDFPRSNWGIFVGSPAVPGDIVNNLIGTSALPNLIAGSLTGIELSGVGGGDTAALENRVQANFIGIAPDGEGALAMQDGVIVRNSVNIRIGQNRPPTSPAATSSAASAAIPRAAY